jgi:hypothetical protein
MVSNGYKFATLLSLALAIVSICLMSIWNTSAGNSIQALNRNAGELSANVTVLQMQNSLLQSQLVEAMMNLSNETILQEGRYIWTIGARRDEPPADFCYTSLTPGFGFTIDNPGAGYFVDDLVIVNRFDLPISMSFLFQPVLKITSVNGMGHVLSFTVLTPGCINTPFQNLPPNPFGTTCVRGSGLTVRRPALVPFNQNVYYAFPTPPLEPAIPLQYANYSLRQVSIESSVYTVLYLYPPAFSMVVSSSSFGGGSILELNVILMNFEPSIPELDSLGYYNYYYPLTKKNFNALNLTDDTNCLANQVCWMDITWGTQLIYPQALQFNQRRWGTLDQFVHSYFQWIFNGVPDFNVGNFVLTLNDPLMIVLPSY